MASDTYTGPQGGSWFDPANWSNGLVPVPGGIADLFGPSSAGPNGGDPSGVDATGGTIAGLTIDLSGVAGQGIYDHNGFYYSFAPNLSADTIGTASAPVSIDVTDDSGTNSQAGLLVNTLNGSIDVASGQALAISEIGNTATLNGNVTIGAGSNLSFSGYSYGGFSDDNPVIFNGAVAVAGGRLDVQSRTVSGTGGIEISNGGKAAFTAVLASNVSIPVSFGTGAGTLDVAQSGLDYTGTISGFGAGDKIVAYNFSAGQYPFTTSYVGDTLTIDQYAFAPEQFSLAGDYTLANFDIKLGADGLDVTYAPCFASGTSIATPQGDRLVERLAVGDLVSLAQGGQAEIVWLGTRRQHDGQVLRIRAGALGDDLPRRDLVVSTDHALHLDGVLVQAGLLVNGETIVEERWPAVTFHHVELARHAILLAEGAPAESYLDTGNRRQFGNCPLAYDALDAARHEPCAELILAGTRLDAIRAKLPLLA